jgi:hypothetical protein
MMFGVIGLAANCFLLSSHRQDHPQVEEDSRLGSAVNAHDRQIIRKSDGTSTVQLKLIRCFIAGAEMMFGVIGLAANCFLLSSHRQDHPQVLCLSRVGVGK